MKNIILFLVSVVPSVLYSQQWQYNYIGNSFDGFARIASVQIDNSMLGIVNESDSINLRFAIGKGLKNGIDQLSIRLVFPDDVAPTKVLLAFDHEQKHYLVNFRFADRKIYINNAISTDYKSFLSLNGIADLLKARQIVHFRVYNRDDFQDYSFPLKGSTDAINKTYLCKTCKSRGNFSDALVELLYFLNLFTQVDGNKNYNNISLSCSDYLAKKFGEYFYTQVALIETASTDTLPALLFKSNSGEIIARIDKDIYLVNYFHFSGNPKEQRDGKINKDLETLDIYYKAFSEYTNIFKERELSLSQFYNLQKTDLMTLYKAVIQNKSFLEFMRKNESVYYNYNPDQYTFEVFIEPWGLRED